jgi:hypothetical protein
MVDGVGEQWSTANEQRCEHCGRVLPVREGPGRPAKYCRRSCRQRAFEMRCHAGDQAWSDARLIGLSERLAAHEDAVDRVREVIDEVRHEVADGREVDAEALLHRLEQALTL